MLGLIFFFLKREREKEKEKEICFNTVLAKQNTSVCQTWQACNSCLPITTTDVVFRIEAPLAQVWSQRGTAGLKGPCQD